MSQSQPGASPAKAENRASHRVRYAIQLEITGIDTSGREFSEPARTEVITRDGGLLICGPSLATGFHVHLRHGDKAARARIVGVVGIRDDEFAYGINFLDTSGLLFWGVEFPPSETETGVGRTVMECGRCNTKQVFELSEMEMMVLESVLVVSHDCRRCGQETLWQVPVLAEPESVISGAAFAEPVTPEKPQRTRNDRKHPRLAMKRTKACIKRLGLPVDVVEVLNVSRGGVCFLSFVDYQPETFLEIAVPYTEGGANVFTPARVVRVSSRAKPPDIRGEYGCQYEKIG